MRTHNTVNNLLLPMMGKPDAVLEEPRRCVVCGRYEGFGCRIELHHVVRRGAGEAYEDSKKLKKPVWGVCGVGNTLKDADGNFYCHGLIHHGMLHPRWNVDHWEYLRTEYPVKYQEALEMEGWRELGQSY